MYNTMGLSEKIPLVFVTLNPLLAGRSGQALGYWFKREHWIWVLTLLLTVWES